MKMFSNWCLVWNDDIKNICFWRKMTISRSQERCLKEIWNKFGWRKSLFDRMAWLSGGVWQQLGFEKKLFIKDGAWYGRCRLPWREHMHLMMQGIPPSFLIYSMTERCLIAHWKRLAEGNETYRFLGHHLEVCLDLVRFYGGIV